MRGRTLALSILLIAGGVAGCSDDGGSDADAQPFIDAMAATIEAEDEGGPTQEQAECIAEETVGVIGVDTFEDEGITPEDVEDSDGPEDLGIELSESQARSISEAFVDECDFSFAAAVAGPDASDELVECLEENIDDDVVVDGLTLQFQGEDEESDALMESMFADLSEACPEIFGG